MFAAVVLGYMAEMLNDVCKNKSLSDECIVLKSEIDRGVITKNTEKYMLVKRTDWVIIPFLTTQTFQVCFLFPI